MALQSWPPMAKRELVVQVKGHDSFRLVGTGRWADFGDAWLCAHDIFHHNPLEANRVVDEVQSFGTQLWLEYPSQGLDCISSDALAGSLLEGVKCPAAFDRLLLPVGPQSVWPIGNALFCKELIAEAMKQLDWRLAETYESIMGKEPTRKMKERIKQITGEKNQAAILEHVAAGYCNGQLRFPYPDKAFTTFEKLQTLLKEASSDFRNVSFSLKENTGLLEFKSVRLRALWLAI